MLCTSCPATAYRVPYTSCRSGLRRIGLFLSTAASRCAGRASRSTLLGVENRRRRKNRRRGCSRTVFRRVQPPSETLLQDWMALSALSVTPGVIQVIADVTSDDRLLVTYDDMGDCRV